MRGGRGHFGSFNYSFMYLHFCRIDQKMRTLSKKIKKELSDLYLKSKSSTTPIITKLNANTYKCDTRLGVCLPSDKEDFTLKCTASPFSCFKDVENHLKNFHKLSGLKSCSSCEVCFVDDSLWLLHKAKDCLKNRFKCEHCPMRFETFKRLSNHQRQLHKQTPRYQCPHCSLMFPSKVIYSLFIKEIRLYYMCFYACTIQMKISTVQMNFNVWFILER